MLHSRPSLARFALLLLSASLGMSSVSAEPAGIRTDDAHANADWSELSASMDSMHHAVAGIRPSADNDLNFVNLMLPHHQAAIDMAKTQLKYGTDPQMRRLAQEIVTDQQSEIELMRLWLKHHEPVAKEKPTK